MPADNTKDKRKSIPSNQVELLFAKSKVYLHPTPRKADNICGFLSLSRGDTNNHTSKDILLSFTPVGQLKPEDLKIYETVDMDDSLLVDSKSSTTNKSNNYLVSKPPTSTLSGYSFSVPLSYIYSTQVRKPVNDLWNGSLIIHTMEGERLPIVNFHDEESPSTKQRQKYLNQKMEIFDDDGEIYWGGKDFVKALGNFIHIEKSTLEPTVYLIDPESEDMRNFSPFQKKLEPPKNAIENFKLPDVNKIFNDAKWKVLETVATISAKARHQVADIIEENAPTPVKQLIGRPEVMKISNEFDSARVYLAKWAAQVKVESEQAQKNFQIDDALYDKINKELGVNSKNPDILTPEEVNKSSRRKAISLIEWQGFFDHSGRLSLTVDEVKNRIFHGGLEDAVRPEAYLFLLGVYSWDSSKEEREIQRTSYETAYEEYKLKWVTDEDKRSTDFWKDQKHRIEKDVNRTDRHLPIFQNPKPVIENHSNSDLEPETPDEDEDEDFDVANIKNPHLFKMREILLTYNEFNENLGYVQGMTDLLSPLYLQIKDESLTFWAFSKFMDRMERNFVRDQLGMKQQMLTLNGLVQFMLPDLFKHLEKCDSTDLFFFFRMLLVWFKREFEWEQVLRLWEILWTDFYSGQFHLFFALSVLSDNERIIKQNLVRFDEVLKYMNDLSMKMNLDDLLVRSELLFLRFRRMVDIIDRENTARQFNQDVYQSTNETEGQDHQVFKISPDLRQLLSKKPIIQKEGPRPEGAGGG